MAETDISRKIKEAVRKKFPQLRFTRLQCGLVKVRGGYMHLSDAGWPDYIGYTPRGTFFGMEIKDPRGHTSKDRVELQHQRHDDIQKCNGWCHEVSSVEEAVGYVQGILDYEEKLKGGFNDRECGMLQTDS